MSDMSSKLPYELTRGVTATREGLEFETGRGWSSLVQWKGEEFDRYMIIRCGRCGHVDWEL